MAIAPVVDWRVALKDKWLLWDTSGVVKAIHYESEDIFDELATLGVTNVYIHPVELELLATNNDKDKLKRSVLLASHFIPMPFTTKELDMAKKLQAAMSSRIQPSIADLYLGATLAVKKSAKFYMITHNIKDFPAPYFKKECYVTLFDDTQVCSLAIVSFRPDSLD